MKRCHVPDLKSHCRDADLQDKAEITKTKRMRKTNFGRRFSTPGICLRKGGDLHSLT